MMDKTLIKGNIVNDLSATAMPFDSWSSVIGGLTSSDKKNRCHAAEAAFSRDDQPGARMKNRLIAALKAAVLQFDEASISARRSFLALASNATDVQVTEIDRRTLARAEAALDRSFFSNGHFGSMDEHQALLRSRRPGTRLLGARSLFDAVNIEGSILTNLAEILCRALIDAFIVEPFVDVRLALLASLKEHVGYTVPDLPEVLHSGGLADMCFDDPDESVVVASVPVVLGLVPGANQGRGVTRALTNPSSRVRLACLAVLQANEGLLMDHGQLVRGIAADDCDGIVRRKASQLVKKIGVTRVQTAK